MDFPTQAVPYRYLHTWSHDTLTDVRLTASSMAAASITWTAKMAVYVPVAIPWPYTVSRVYWGTGSAASGTSTDFGIYTFSGTRLYSTGLIANANSELKYVTPTQFTLAPGRYYFALSNDGSTNACFGVGSISTSVSRIAGVMQQDLSAGTGALPATATFAAITVGTMPFCGITSTLVA